MPDARTVLGDDALGSHLDRLGLRPDDLPPTLAVARTVLGRPADLAEVDRLAGSLRQGLGHFPGEPEHEPWPLYDPASDPHGHGVLALLALAVTAGDLAEYHRSRGVPAEVSDRTLTELGQQVWVHRLTYGELGLHTYDWLTVTWSGSLYWLGRLQFNLQLTNRGWVCSTHIPRSGPLDPDAVDASLAAAARFFPEHFPDRPVEDFWCRSWLLDPTLAAALDPASNMARFQSRWRLYGDPMPGDEDALFFTFARRGEVDLDGLPRDTSLQRAIVDRLRAGGHWTVRDGLLPLAAVAEGAA